MTEHSMLGARVSVEKEPLPLNPMDAIKTLLIRHSWDYESGECMCGVKGGAAHTATLIGLWHSAIVGELEDQRDRAEEALAQAATVARSYRRFTSAEVTEGGRCQVGARDAHCHGCGPDDCPYVASSSTPAEPSP